MRTLIFISLLLLVKIGFPDTLPNAQFVTSENKPLQFYDLKGNHLFISFVYTRCPLPKMCPLTMTLNKQVWRKVKNTLPSTKVKFLIVTLDPESDTPQMLKNYAKKFTLNEKDFVLVTGSTQVLSDFASQFNVIGFANPDRTVSHNLKSILVAPDLSPIKEYKENEWKPTQVIADLKENIKPSLKESGSKAPQ